MRFTDALHELSFFLSRGSPTHHMSLSYSIHTLYHGCDDSLQKGVDFLASKSSYSENCNGSGQRVAEKLGCYTIFFNPLRHSFTFLARICVQIYSKSEKQLLAKKTPTAGGWIFRIQTPPGGASNNMICFYLMPPFRLMILK